MPYLLINTNQSCAQADRDAVLLDYSRATADLLGKPESYVMVQLQDQQAMCFGGNTEPTALLKLASIGLSSTQTEQLSAEFCALTKRLFSVPPERCYIQFQSVDRAFWGWNNRSFA